MNANAFSTHASTYSAYSTCVRFILFLRWTAFAFLIFSIHSCHDAYIYKYLDKYITFGFVLFRFPSYHFICVHIKITHTIFVPHIESTYGDGDTQHTHTSTLITNFVNNGQSFDFTIFAFVFLYSLVLPFWHCFILFPLNFCYFLLNTKTLVYTVHFNQLW